MGNIPRSQIDPTTSILAQLKDKRTYPELTALGEFFARDIRIYREWGFGRKSLLRQAQSIDLRKDSLEPDCSNLALMMAEAKLNVAYRNDIIDALRLLNPRFYSYEIQVVGRSLDIMIEEEGQFFSAARLSDGTLRFLALAVILCNPNPPKVILIDEPELGLHPDILPQLADMLKKASERCQLIVTTHSEMLVDALSESPEDILVCERKEQGTTLTRLDAKELEPLLENASVGHLWLKGEIGGTRW